MSIQSFLTRHATLERYVITDDLAGGQSGVWTEVGPVTLSLTSPKSEVALDYKREGYNNITIGQALDRLPRRLLGHTCLSDLFRDITLTRIRFTYQGRTLHPIAFRTPMDGATQGLAPIVNMDLSDTVQPKGYVDVVTPVATASPEMSVIPIPPESPLAQGDPLGYFTTIWTEALATVGIDGIVSNFNNFATWNANDATNAAVLAAFSNQRLFAQISRSDIETVVDAGTAATFQTNVGLLLTKWAKPGGVGPGLLSHVNLAIECNAIMTGGDATSILRRATLADAVAAIHYFDPEVSVGASFQFNTALTAGNVAAITTAMSAIFDWVGFSEYPSTVGTPISSINAARYADLLNNTTKPIIVCESGYKSDLSADYGELAQREFMQLLYDVAKDTQRCPIFVWTYLYDDETNWMGLGTNFAGMGLRNGPLTTGITKQAYSRFISLRDAR